MKLSTLAGPHALIQQPHAHDIDAGSNAAPAIGRHISSLKSLLALVPDSEDLCAKVAEIEAMLASRTNPGTPMIEMQQQPPTILDYDENKPLGQQRAHIHGVGSSAVGYLPTKIVREASFVGDVISEIDGMESGNPDYDQLIEKYNELNRWTQQLARTTNTLSAAASEMARYRQSRRRSGYLENQDDTVRPIPQSEIDRMIADNHVIAMYETMKVGLGERAWVAISKRLRAQGMDPQVVERIINRAIVLSE